MCYSYNSDKEYARDVCDKDPKATKKIQEDFMDILFYISRKYVKTYSNDYWIHTTSKGAKVKVNDDIMDSYIWLMKQLVKKCCKYKAINDASLKTYLIAVLNSKYLFNDWLKNKYGGSTYIPKCLKNLSDTDQDIFIKLRRGKNKNRIASDCNLSLNVIEEKMNNIINILVNNNLLDMIKTPIVKNIEDFLPILLDTSIPDPETATVIENTKNIIQNVLLKLDKPEKRLLMIYWGKGLSSKKIIRFINSPDSITDFSPLKIEKKSDVYKTIRKINRKLLKIVKRKHTAFYEQYNMDKKKMKSLLKVFLENFETKP